MNCLGYAELGLISRKVELSPSLIPARKITYPHKLLNSNMYRLACSDRQIIQTAVTLSCNHRNDLTIISIKRLYDLA